MNHNWTEKQIKAINASIEHWHENLMILQLNYLSGEELNKDFGMLGCDCALCTLHFKKGCYYCPLHITGNDCNYYDSAWRMIFDQLNSMNIFNSVKEDYHCLFKATANMINTLEGLLD